MKKLAKVFISYAAADRQAAEALMSGLEAAGVDVANRFDAIKSEQDNAKAVRSQLAHSDAFISLVPAFEGEGRWALMELGAARMQEKPILGFISDRTRFANSDVVKRISNGRLLDGTGMRADEISQRIASFVHESAEKRASSKRAVA